MAGQAAAIIELSDRTNSHNNGEPTSNVHWEVSKDNSRVAGSRSADIVADVAGGGGTVREVYEVKAVTSGGVKTMQNQVGGAQKQLRDYAGGPGALVPNSIRGTSLAGWFTGYRIYGTFGNPTVYIAFYADPGIILVMEAKFARRAIKSDAFKSAGIRGLTEAEIQKAEKEAADCNCLFSGLPEFIKDLEPAVAGAEELEPADPPYFPASYDFGGCGSIECI